MGTVILPYDFIVTAYFQHHFGSSWARTLVRVYFPSDIPTNWSYASGILTEPSGSRRNPAYTMLDMRLGKSFSFGDYGKPSFYVDIFTMSEQEKHSMSSGIQMAGSGSIETYLNIVCNPTMDASTALQEFVLSVSVLDILSKQK